MEEHYEMYIAKGLEKKEAMRKVAQDRGISRRDVYKNCLNKCDGNVFTSISH